MNIIATTDLQSQKVINYYPKDGYISIVKLLEKQLNTRYLQPTKEIKGKRNLIIDNYIIKYLPKLLTMIYEVDEIYEKKEILENFPASSYVMNRWFSKLLDIPAVPLKDLFLMQGYTMNYLKQLLLDVRRKNLHISLAGLGGFGCNFVYLLTELAKETNTYSLFDQLDIYEDDLLEFSNTIRMMTPNILKPNKINNGALLVSMFEPYYRDIVPDYFTRKLDIFSIRELSCLVKRNKVCTHRKRLMYSLREEVVIGSPDIASREIFTNKFKENTLEGFLCPLHKNEKMYLWANPEVDPILQSESYGLIDLGRFFLNMVRVTVEILEALRDEKYKELDYLISEFTTTSIDNSKTSRNYFLEFNNQTLM